MSQIVTFYKLKKEQLKQFFEADDKLKYDSGSLSFNGLFFSSLDFFQRKTIFSKVIQPHSYKNSKGELHDDLSYWYPSEIAELFEEMKKLDLGKLKEDWNEEFFVDFNQILAFFQSASIAEKFIVEQVSY